MQILVLHTNYNTVQYSAVQFSTVRTPLLLGQGGCTRYVRIYPSHSYALRAAVSLERDHGPRTA